jgi:hypothetical protein
MSLIRIGKRMLGVVQLRVGGAWLPYWSEEDGAILERDAARDFHMEKVWQEMAKRMKRP